MSSIRKRLQPLIAIACEYGARICVDNTRRHIRLVVETGRGNQRLLTMARTPSDWRGDLNNQSRLRRLLRNA